MGASHIKPFDIVWIDDQYSNLYPLMRPLIDQGFSLTGLETYFDVADRLETIRLAKLIVLDMIIPPGPIDPPITTEKYLGLAALKFLREQGVQVPTLVYTVVRDEEAIADILAHDPLVVKVFQKGGKFKSSEFTSQAREIIMKRAQQ